MASGSTAMLRRATQTTALLGFTCSCQASTEQEACIGAHNSRRLVGRERSILRGDGGRFTTSPPSRPEARRRFGFESANELGAPVASSIPEQLRGREPASARKGYEDALVLRNRRVERSFGRHGVARGAMLFGAE